MMKMSELKPENVTPRRLDVNFNFTTLRHEARCPVCGIIAFWISAEAIKMHRQVNPSFMIPIQIVHPCKVKDEE
jgi:hypothetical protein